LTHARRALLPRGLRVLAAAPWRRAPLLLLRSPAALLAVLFAGLVLGATAAATPLYVSSHRDDPVLTFDLYRRGPGWPRAEGSMANLDLDQGTVSQWSATTWP
jgi:hypothetical protein